MWTYSAATDHVTQLAQPEVSEDVTQVSSVSDSKRILTRWNTARSSNNPQQEATRPSAENTVGPHESPPGEATHHRANNFNILGLSRISTQNENSQFLVRNQAKPWARGTTPSLTMNSGCSSDKGSIQPPVQKKPGLNILEKARQALEQNTIKMKTPDVQQEKTGLASLASKHFEEMRGKVKEKVIGMSREYFNSLTSVGPPVSEIQDAPECNPPAVGDHTPPPPIQQPGNKYQHPPIADSVTAPSTNKKPNQTEGSTSDASRDKGDQTVDRKDGFETQQSAKSPTPQAPSNDVTDTAVPKVNEPSGGGDQQNQHRTPELSHVEPPNAGVANDGKENEDVHRDTPPCPNGETSSSVETQNDQAARDDVVKISALEDQPSESGNRDAEDLTQKNNPQTEGRGKQDLHQPDFCPDGANCVDTQHAHTATATGNVVQMSAEEYKSLKSLVKDVKDLQQKVKDLEQRPAGLKVVQEVPTPDSSNLGLVWIVPEIIHNDDRIRKPLHQLAQRVHEQLEIRALPSSSITFHHTGHVVLPIIAVSRVGSDIQAAMHKAKLKVPCLVLIYNHLAPHNCKIRTPTKDRLSDRQLVDSCQDMLDLVFWNGSMYDCEVNTRAVKTLRRMWNSSNDN